MINLYGMRCLVGDTPQRGGISISVQLEMTRGWSGGGGRSRNIIVRLNADYSGGVFLRTRSRSGKICINEVLLAQDGVPYAGLRGNLWYICSLNVPTVWRYG